MEHNASNYDKKKVLNSQHSKICTNCIQYFFFLAIFFALFIHKKSKIQLTGLSPPRNIIHFLILQATQFNAGGQKAI